MFPTLNFEHKCNSTQIDISRHSIKEIYYFHVYFLQFLQLNPLSRFFMISKQKKYTLLSEHPDECSEANIAISPYA